MKQQIEQELTRIIHEAGIPSGGFMAQKLLSSIESEGNASWKDVQSWMFAVAVYTPERGGGITYEQYVKIKQLIEEVAGPYPDEYIRALRRYNGLRQGTGANKQQIEAVFYPLFAEFAIPTDSLLAQYLLSYANFDDENWNNIKRLMYVVTIQGPEHFGVSQPQYEAVVLRVMEVAGSFPSWMNEEPYWLRE